MTHYNILAYTPSSTTMCPDGQSHLRDAYVQQGSDTHPRNEVRRVPVAQLLSMVAGDARFFISLRDERDVSRTQQVTFPLCTCGAAHTIDPRVANKEQPIGS